MKIKILPRLYQSRTGSGISSVCNSFQVTSHKACSISEQGGEISVGGIEGFDRF